MTCKNFFLAIMNKSYSNNSNKIIVQQSRTAVNEKILTEYHKKLTERLIDVPAYNSWKYNETGLVNDPGKVKCIMKL